MATTETSPTISIDVKDLASFSALKTALTSDQSAIFSILGELEKFALQPVKEAAAAKASAKVVLGASASWKTANGIGFSLTPTASCSVSIDVASETIPVAMSIESSQTTNIAAGPTPGIAYVNIDLDFSIQGSVSGSGTFSGVGIAGKASGSEAATLTYCQPVDDSTPTLTAIQTAFSQLIFPLDPTCTKNMPTGAIAKVSFDGAIQCGVDVTYGLGDHKVSAPSLAKVQQSLQGVAKITLPSLDINAGAKGSVTYNHADHFALIVEKTDDATAMLYLVRSSENDWGASVGVTVGVTTTTDASVTIDPAALQTVVGNVTGNSALAGQVVSQASGGLNSLETTLNGKLKSWVSDVTGQAGLTVGLGRQKGHASLFTFKVNLAEADLAAQSWSALVGGSIVEALALKGFTVQAGSGVSDSLKRSSTIQFQFFNLFSFQSTTDYFSNAYSELGPDGTIRVFRDVGQEEQIKTKKALAQFRIHFVATATQDALSNVSQANVDLQIELSESGSAKDGAALANVVGLIPAAAVGAAQTAMITYLASHPTGKVNLISIVRRPAYQKLSCTGYNGNKPGPLPHVEDQNNWEAFQSATEALAPNLGFVSRLSFPLWVNFNRISIDQVGSTVVPDRRQEGNPNNVPPSFYAPIGAPGSASFFLLASAGFMNLCEDLTILARSTPGVDDTEQWNSLLIFLTKIVTDDLFIDFAKPTAGALLSQCTVGGAEVTAVADAAQDSSSFTCTVTMG